MNWPVLIIVGATLVALIIFLIIRNQKDEQTFEHQLNEDYHKSRDEQADADPEESPK